MTIQLYIKNFEGKYIKIHPHNIRTIWRPIETIPKTGKEFLVCNTKQGNTLSLIRWDKIYKQWKNKEKSVLSLQADYWSRITIPIKHER